LGQAGRDGTILAVEECNDGGGIQGHPVELLIRDDSHGTAQIGTILASLSTQGAQAAVGPMTNEMAVRLAVAAPQFGIVLMSPTVTSDQLAGQDDLFFRVYPTSDVLMGYLARYMHERRLLQRPVVIVDDTLGAYALEMAADFDRAYTVPDVAGGPARSPVKIVRYSSVAGDSLPAAVGKAVFLDPDSVVILAGPRQTALICQYLKKAGCNVPMATTELAANGDLLAYGGSAIEGLFFYHTFDRYYPSERYETFRYRFRRRFGHEPNYAAVHAYDAARVLLTAIAEKQPRTELRHALAEMHYFEGVQARFAISETGDVRRELFLVTVRNGAYRAME
jgi:branched-chain amino acid transport system substrate-binding protein